MDLFDCEEDDFFLNPLPSSPSLSPSLLLTEDANKAVESLISMIKSPIFCMRIESLKIFVEILSENNLANDRKQIVEAFYRLNLIQLFVEHFIQLVNHFDSQYNHSDIFFEFHLLTLILSRVVQIKISQVSFFPF